MRLHCYTGIGGQPDGGGQASPDTKAILIYTGAGGEEAGDER